MPLSKLFLKLLERLHSACFDVSQAALDAIECLPFVHEVDESLIRTGLLHDKFGLTVNCEHHRMTAATHLLQKFACVALEVAQGVDVFSNIDHMTFQH